MPKSLALTFALLAVVLMSATAISIAHNGWLAVLFFFLTLSAIVAGFIVKAKLRRSTGKA